MLFHSTRGKDHNKTFEDVLMQGLAADGGLFMPDVWPQVDIEKIKTLDSFNDVAKCIVPLFTKSSFTDAEVLELLDDTWHDFSTENFAAIHQLDDTKSILELLHGPTAAFAKKLSLFCLANFKKAFGFFPSKSDIKPCKKTIKGAPF